jgi:hypothetical protein
MGTSIDVTKTQKNAGRIWFGLAVPAASQYLTLTGGSPDATENPNRKLVGLTEQGAMIGMTKTFTEEFFDEFKYPLERNLDQIGATIKCDASQVLDEDLLSIATVGVGTPLTPTGKKAWTIGEGTLSFTSVAVIAPTKADSTKYVVFHLYQAYNNAPFEMPISRQTRAKISLEFVGLAVTSRAATDLVGALWYQTS